MPIGLQRGRLIRPPPLYEITDIVVESAGDGAEKEQRAFDISLGVLRVFPARRSGHLLSDRGTDRDEKVAPASGGATKVSAEQTRLLERSVLCRSLSYHMAYYFD